MPTTRAAAPADLPALRTVCALAYHTNPLMRWVLPDEATRDEACALWLGPSLERYLAAGRVDVVTVDDEVVAVAAWRPAAPVPAAAPTHLPTPAGALAALVGPARAAEVLGALGTTAGLAPDRPGPYLNYLAVHPAHQGRGLGGALLRHGLASLADADGSPWLATTDERNVPFYERHGFATAGSRRLPGDGPVLRVLHAAARHASGTAPG